MEIHNTGKYNTRAVKREPTENDVEKFYTLTRKKYIKIV